VAGLSEPPTDETTRTCLVHGWVVVLISVCLGLALEALHLFKSPFYLEVSLRRDLWTLAHAHGTLLGLVVVVMGYSARSLISTAKARSTPLKLLRAASVFVPCGFFLGGVGASEGDPSLFILLVPFGAALLLLGIGLILYRHRFQQRRRS
jgi:hypothetical protein